MEQTVENEFGRRCGQCKYARKIPWTKGKRALTCGIVEGEVSCRVLEVYSHELSDAVVSQFGVRAGKCKYFTT